MPLTDVSIQSDEKLSVTDYEAAAREMQDVLSRRLPAFHRLAYRLLGNAEDAEDAVQDALLAAHQNLKQFRGEAQMSTWLTAIVFNSARMHLRKRPRVQLISLDHRVDEEHKCGFSEHLAHHGPSPEDECRNAEALCYLAHLTTRLPSLLQRTFWLRTIEELSISETCRVLGLSSEAVKSHLFRARAKLKRIMNKRGRRNPRVAGSAKQTRDNLERGNHGLYRRGGSINSL
jgi:RNA polymerase sigma factor (sigma-70 family)